MKPFNILQRVALPLILLLAGWAGGTLSSHAEEYALSLPQPGVNLSGTSSTVNGKTVIQPLDSWTLIPDKIVMLTEKGSANNVPAYYESSSSARFYAGNAFSVQSLTPETLKISELRFYVDDYSTTDVASLLVDTSDSLTYEKRTHPVTGAARNCFRWVGSTPASTIRFHLPTFYKNQVRISCVEIIYSEEVPAPPTPPMPLISHPGGQFSAPFSVSLTNMGEEGTGIVYTLDGTDPSSTNGTPYTTPILIETGANVTLKAVCIDPRTGLSSDIAEATYTYVRIPKLSLLIEGRGIDKVYVSSPSVYRTCTSNSEILIPAGEQVQVSYATQAQYAVKEILLDGQVMANANNRGASFPMPADDVTVVVRTEFNPSSPADPPMPISKYNLDLTVNPVGAASLSGAGRYEEGKRVYVSASANTGYVFRNWTLNGEVVSSSRSFYFTIPSADCVLTANFVFDPSSPADPSAPVLKRPLSAVAFPAGSATMSVDQERVDEGATYRVWCDPKPGYRVVGWSVNGVAQEEAGNSTFFQGVMTADGAQVVARLMFDPASPGNPGANPFTPSNGVLIIDDFAPDHLYDAIRNAISNAGGNDSQLTTVIVKGSVTANDIYNLTYFSSLATIDLSRTFGWNTVPYSAFYNSKASSIILPSDITRVENYAFERCPNLTSLTLFALEPPVCASSALYGLNTSACTLYVPAASLEIYQSHAQWGKFNVMPNTADVRTLQVNLPDDCTDGRYRNSTLEITNLTTGVRQKYVVSDRSFYTFNGLLTNDEYSVTLTSKSGVELARIDRVVIGDTDMEVTFDSVRRLYTVAARVVGADAVDLTSQVTVEWLRVVPDAAPVYLRKGATLSEIPSGESLICRITLPEKLGTEYFAPADREFTVGAADGVCTVELERIGNVALSGSVVNSDNRPVQGASVSVTQTVNDRFRRTFTASTDSKGEWAMTVLRVPSGTVSYTATECVGRTDTLPAFALEAVTVVLETVKLRSMVGATITYGFTYSAPGVGVKEDFFTDYKNVEITVYNLTRKQPHTDLSVQYPQLSVLDENILPGDSLRLTASSRTGAFRPVTVDVEVGENQRANAVFAIVGKGGISATFSATDNPGVVAMLYSSKGELITKIPYANSRALFTELNEGSYTLVSMGQSDLMNSVLRLGNFAELGLQEGRDYVKHSAEVTDGVLTEIAVGNVPAFDESLFYYTGTATSFTANKSSITTGNYLTLRAAIDFKSVYRAGISNVELVVDLPEGCSFVDKSVIQGTAVIPYTLDGNRLTVSLGKNYSNQVRFCVVPLKGGLFNAAASINFAYNGRTISQPIGTVQCTVKDIEISVPDVTRSAEFMVSGVASPRAEVEVRANSAVVGRTTANAIGNWTASCTLPSPVNLTTYNVNAAITGSDKRVLISETRQMLYDKDAIAPANVSMSFYNKWYRKQITVDWDFATGRCSSNRYDFYTTTDFTFALKFTENNPDKVQNVVLNVFTSSGEVRRLSPVFSEEKQCWVATDRFTSSSLPNNVSVDYQLTTTGRVDASFLKGIFEVGSPVAAEAASTRTELDSWSASLEEAATAAEREAAIVAKFTEMGIPVDAPPSTLTPEEIEAELNAAPAIPDFLANLSAISPMDDAVGEYMKGVTVGNCSGITEAELLAAGYQAVQKTDGTSAYYLATDKEWVFVDLASNVRVAVDSSALPAKVRAKSASADAEAEGKLAELRAACEKLKELVGGVSDYLGEAIDKLGEARKLAQADNAKLLSAYRSLNDTPNGRFLARILERRMAANIALIKGLDATENWLRHNFKQYLVGEGLIAGKAFGFVALVNDAFSAVQDVQDLIALGRSLTTPCQQAESATDQLRNSVIGASIAASSYHIVKLHCNIAEVCGVTAGLSALIPSGGTSTSAVLAAMAVMAGNMAADYIYSRQLENFKFNTQGAYERLRELCKKQEKDPKEYEKPFNPRTRRGKPSDYPKPKPPIFTPVNPILDPSGYVYEAVPANRVQGVQASIYYKEIKEDMYGDPYEDIMLWNAEEYAQKNPLFTDENGMYAWDVPQGLWQVKFEKDGYVTAYSEWLPVPPPQLDVNVGIVQRKQPEVIEARAYEEGVEVQFDKFMTESTLTPANIYVTANGEKLPGEIRFVDSTVASEFAQPDDPSAPRFTSRVRFVPATPLSLTTGEIRITVSRNVASYAGIPMAQTFTQLLDVEKEVQSIAASPVKVLFGQSSSITVCALPSEAAAGKTLRIASSASLIASVDLAEAVLDAEGKAVITVKGELPGSTELLFTIDGVAATGSAPVDVVKELVAAHAPKASRATGTTLYPGSRVALTTESPDAEIWFTTDGSCPCDENGTRRRYTVPIVITDNVRIQAMTVVKGSESEPSEIVEFTYTLKQANMEFPLQEGWNWVSHSFHTPLTPAQLGADPAVKRILSAEAEAVRNEGSDFTGTLISLPAFGAYKVETTAPTTRTRIVDTAWNPSTPISLKAGWNWLGYPMPQTMTLAEAFATTPVEPLDVVVGLDGFSQYDGQQWVGTLQTLTPGKGYMYQSTSAKNIVFNTAIVSNAAALNATGHRATPAVDIAVDIHKYPSVMPVIATTDGTSLSTGHTLAAFCNNECRGVATNVNGIQMLPVHGNPGDQITFRLISPDGRLAASDPTTLSFGEQVVGNLAAPYVIHLQNVTSLSSTTLSGNVTVKVEGGLLHILGPDPSEIDLVEIYAPNGAKLLTATSLSPHGSINISTLPVGPYAILVRAYGTPTYHKAILR